MSRIFPYLGAILAIFFVLALLGAKTVPQSAPQIAQTNFAPTTTAAVPNSTATSSTPVATSTPSKPKPAVKTPPKTATSTQSAPEVQVITYTQADFDAAAANVHSALVNILCTASAGSGLTSISGSGVFIDSKGIILTNAHVAQYFLFKDKGVSCTIRTGGPATVTYTAAPIFISSNWVAANADLLSKETAVGTGQYDFALLAVTGSANGIALANLFPSVSLADYIPYTSEPVVIGSYGAQFLTSQEVISSLFPTLVFGSIKDVFTFATTSVDVVALGGTVAAQEGSSGGGVVDPKSNLIGIITTSTTEGDTSTRNVNAITTNYIEREYHAETDTSLSALLAEPTNQSTIAFAPSLPGLEAEIVQNLNKH